MSAPKATGYVRIIKRANGPVALRQAEAPRRHAAVPRLGKLWTKRSTPPGGFLTRAQAEARLAAILAGDDPLVNIAPSHVTLRQACDERLRYLEHDKRRKPSTSATTTT